MLEGKPKYLEIKRSKKKIMMIARFRCCNEWRGDGYQERGEKKVCKTCGWKKETWQYLREKCSTRTELSEEDFMLKKLKDIKRRHNMDEKGLCEKQRRGSYRKYRRKVRIV